MDGATLGFPAGPTKGPRARDTRAQAGLPSKGTYLNQRRQSLQGQKVRSVSAVSDGEGPACPHSTGSWAGGTGLPCGGTPTDRGGGTADPEVMAQRPREPRILARTRKGCGNAGGGGELHGPKVLGTARPTPPNRVQVETAMLRPMVPSGPRGQARPLLGLLPKVQAPHLP